jgi:hypothetical protein
MYVIVGFGDMGRTLYQHVSLIMPHLVIDPKYPSDRTTPFTTWDQVARRDDIKGILVCVSTPTVEQTGQSDAGNVRDVLKRIARHCPNVPVLVLSHLSEDAWPLLKKQFAHLNLSYLPNFLFSMENVEKSYLLFYGSDVSFWSAYCTHVSLYSFFTMPHRSAVVDDDFKGVPYAHL